MPNAQNDVAADIVERTRGFVGREWVLGAIDAWFVDGQGPRFFAITGEPGIGKTAIAARLIQTRHVDAYHFCQARRTDSLDPLNFVRSLSLQLTRIGSFAKHLVAEQGTTINVDISVGNNQGTIVGVQIEQLIVRAPSASVAFNRAVLDPLKAMYEGDAASNRPLLIVVDALDEAAQQPGSETIVRLLADATALPPQVRVVVTSRPDAAVLRHFERQKISFFTLYATSDQQLVDLQAYVNERVAASGALQEQLQAARVPAPTFTERVTAASEGNFLYLVFVLTAVAEGRQRLDDLGSLPQGLDGIYREFLRTRAVGKDTAQWRVYRPLLGVLAAAQTPLGEAAVARFAGTSRQAVADFATDIGQFLDTSQAAQGRLALYHQSLSNFLNDKDRAGEFWIDLPAIHEQIASTYLETRDAMSDSYALHYLARHLFLAGNQQTLHALLLRLPWLEAKLAELGVNALLADYDLPLGNEAALALVRSALRMAAHALVQDPAQLCTQLWGRLNGSTVPDVVRLLTDIDARRSAPWIRAMHPTMLRPGGALVRTLTGHDQEVVDIAVLPDGVRALSASDDHSLRLWDLDRGEVLRVYQGHTHRLNAVAITPDGRRAVATDWDHTLRLWDVETGRMLRAWSDPDFILGGPEVTPDGDRALFVPYGKAPRSWMLNTGECETILPKLSNTSTSLALLDRGKRAIFVVNNVPQLWDLQSRVKIRGFDAHPTLNALTVSPDGRRLITGGGESGSEEGDLRVYDVETGQIVHRLDGHAGWVSAIAITPDGRRIVSASSDRTLKVWDLESGALLKTLRGHTREVLSVAVLPDNRRAISGGGDHSLRLWDLEAAGAEPIESAHADVVCALAVTADGTRAISGSWDRTARIWDIESGAVVKVLAEHSWAVTDIALSVDGKDIVTSSGDGSLCIWSASSGRLKKRIICDYRDEDGGLEAVRVAPGAKLAVVMRKPWELELWNLTTAKRNRTLSKGAYSDTGLAMTADGRLVLAATYEGNLRIWDLKKGTERTIVRPSEPNEPAVAETISVTADGLVAAVGHRDGMARVWDVKARTVVLTAHPHREEIHAVRILPDGRHAASCSEDWSLCVWALATGDVRARFTGDGPLRALAVSTDGRTLVTGEASGRVHFLQLENLIVPVEHPRARRRNRRRAPGKTPTKRRSK